MRSVLVTTIVLLLGCSNASAPPSAPGAPADGPADTHCEGRAQATSAYSCISRVGVSQGAGDVHVAHDPDASIGGGYGATLFGTSGADDACKYDIAWTSTELRRDVDVFFTVTVQARMTHARTIAAAPRAEVLLGTTHPAPDTEQASDEGPQGTYRIGPLRFDAAGRWTVRFHFFPECSATLPDSPHGHAAFYVDLE